MNPGAVYRTFAEILPKKIELGHEFVLLKLHRSNSPKNWDRFLICRARPSLYGRVVGCGNYPGLWVVEVRIADIQSWMAQVEL